MNEEENSHRVEAASSERISKRRWALGSQFAPVNSQQWFAINASVSSKRIGKQNSTLLQCS